MILDRLGLVHKNQRGFTLIEMLIAIAVTGLIVGGIAMAIFQTLTVSARNSSHMTMVRQVQNAGYWISHDVQMAQEVQVDGGATGFPLVLTWTEGDSGDEYLVVYTLLVVDNELQREFVIRDANGVEIGSGATIVARFIDTDPTKTKCELSGDVVSVTITSTTSGFQGEVSETRVYETTPRPNLW